MKCPANKHGLCTYRMCNHAMSCQKIEEFRQCRDILIKHSLVVMGFDALTAIEIIDRLEIYGYKIVRKELVR